VGIALNDTQIAAPSGIPPRDYDLTASDDRWRGPRRREILRAREEFCRMFFDPNPPAGSADGLKRYFLAFATAARR
jgi:hypothetical protein